MTGRDEFFYRLGREGLPIGAGPAFMRLARALERLNVRESNEGGSDAIDRARKRHRAAAVDLARELGIIAVQFGGDPRGYALALLLPSGASNSWGGDPADGWGVPS